jgi:predicted PurR-regulated permease PerM
LVIVLFIGVYAAVEPSIYRRGFLVLIPPQHRDRTGKVISEVVDTLRWWLIGKFISMTIIGVLTTVGLWIMGIPLALALGIIAAIFTFIPNIGPLLSAIPAVLLGLIDSPQQALYIAALYVGIQTVESYMITPLIQRKTVSLPPALTLSAQVLLGVIFGGLGVALATPMTAAALVLSRMLYVDDTGVFKGDRLLFLCHLERHLGRSFTLMVFIRLGVVAALQRSANQALGAHNHGHRALRPAFFRMDRERLN